MSDHLPPGPAELVVTRLGGILGAALDEARVSFGHEAGSDPFHGLYINAGDAERCLEAVGAGRFSAKGTVVDEPPWSAIVCDDPRWAWLAESYGLSDFELDVVLIALAPEIDTRYGRVYGYLNDDVGQRLATVDLALNILTHDAGDKFSRRAAFAPDAPLLRCRVLTLTPNPRTYSQALLTQCLQLDNQIVDVLLGSGGLDRRLSRFCHLVRPQPGSGEASLSADVRDSLLQIVAQVWGSRPLTMYFHGPRGVGKRAAAEAIAAHLHVPLLVVAAGLLPSDDSLDELLAVVFREAQLHGAVILIDEFDAFTDGRWLLAEHLSAYQGLTVLAGVGAWVPFGRHALGTLVVEFERPDFARRRDAWAKALCDQGTDTPSRDLDALAGRFRLTTAQIHDAVLAASNQALRHGYPTKPELFAAARGQSGSELAALARKLEPTYGWDDIVLPVAATAQLRELSLRVVHRERVMAEWGFQRVRSHGTGVTALFAGPPGTGKTMAAEVVAHELGVDLYKIDMSSVVSKYIGETEKNLERIFTAAPLANACLLFDEADAIFGKRSAVQDAHDRYANMEISYLLQRMEDYDGLAILTTNLRDHLDEAFIRRLQFVVEFPLPDESDRLRIWHGRIPRDAPRDAAIDFEYLARTFALAGGNISNITLAAAFLAAADDAPIGMAHLLSAVRSEYAKMGKVVPAKGLS